MSLEKTYSKEIKQILAKYPPEGKRSAVMPLLHLAQRDAGYVDKAAMQEIAKIVDITETDVAAVVGERDQGGEAGKAHPTSLSTDHARTGCGPWAALGADSP